MWQLAGRKATIRLERDREFADSPLEGAGFELRVPTAEKASPPRGVGTVRRAYLWTEKPARQGPHEIGPVSRIEHPIWPQGRYNGLTQREFIPRGSAVLWPGYSPPCHQAKIPDAVALIDAHGLLHPCGRTSQLVQRADRQHCKYLPPRGTSVAPTPTPTGKSARIAMNSGRRQVRLGQQPSI
jgi:hypothetical protein